MSHISDGGKTTWPPRPTDEPGAPATEDAARRRRTAVSAGLVSLVLLGVNALAYVVTVMAARVLAPEAYGELAALLGIMFIGVVPATGLQTAAALRLGARPADPRLVAERVHLAAMAAALVVAVIGLVTLFPLVALLHLSGPAPVLLVLATLLPHTMIGGYDGILQGTGRYRRLAMVNALLGILKSGGGVAGLLVGGSPTAALAGMALGCTASAVLGWFVTGRPGIARGIRPTVRSATVASGALLGLVLLVNLDLLLARHHLPADLAGEYAVGSILTKTAFWLPQGVSVVLLPRLVHAGARRRTLPVAVALVAALGGVLTLGTALLGSRTLPLIGGTAYGDELSAGTWVFTLLGSLLAVAQLLLYSGIAAADHAAGAAVWAAAVLECVAVEVLAATGRLELLWIAQVAVVAACLLVVAGSWRAWHTRHDALQPGGPPSSVAVAG